MCVVHVKYYNHLLAVDMADVACRGLRMRVVGKMSKDIGMGVCKGTVVSFVPSLFGCFLGIPSLFILKFFKMFFVTCFGSFFLGGGGGGGISKLHMYATQVIIILVLAGTAMVQGPPQTTAK